jgi:hypothetical protein
MKIGGRPTSRRSPGERIIPQASTIRVVYGLAMELAKEKERGAPTHSTRHMRTGPKIAIQRCRRHVSELAEPNRSQSIGHGGDELCRPWCDTSHIVESGFTGDF